MAAGVTYRVATPKDCDLVLEFLREHFYPEEPLTIACEPLQQEKYDEDSMRLNILNEYETCVIAMSRDRIVGVFLAAKKGPDEERLLLEEASTVPGTKWAKLLIFLASIERNNKVYERFKVDKALHGDALAVHRMFRGKGIGLELLERSIERARELGYPLYTCHCSSVYSAKLCEHLGMDLVNVYSLADYRAPGSDKQVYFPPKEHKYMKTFAKRLL